MAACRKGRFSDHLIFTISTETDCVMRKGSIFLKGFLKSYIE